MRADHAKTKDYCMTRFFGHGQSILQVFETSIALSMVKSVKSPFFQTLLVPCRIHTLLFKPHNKRLWMLLFHQRPLVFAARLLLGRFGAVCCGYKMAAEWGTQQNSLVILDQFSSREGHRAVSYVCRTGNGTHRSQYAKVGTYSDNETEM